MKNIGINLLVWSGEVGAAELALFPSIKQMGYTGVELPIFAPDQVNVQAIRAALADNDLHCTVSTALPPGLSLIDEPGRAKGVHWLRSVVEVAAALGASTLCGPMAVPVGELRGRGYTTGEWHSAVRSFQEVGQTAADCGITVALEPLNRFETFLVNTVADGVRLCQEVDNPAIGLLLDTFHMHIEEKSTADAIRYAGHHVKHFHCSENDRGIVGSGQVSWSEVFQALQDIDYTDWLVVESFNAVIPELAGATCIWRPLAESPAVLAQESLSFLHPQLSAVDRNA